MTFIKDIFDVKYSNILDGRTPSFRALFSYLEENNIHNPVIVETGTCTTKNPGSGISTFLFEEYVNYYNGEIWSVDINKTSCDWCNENTNDKVNVVCDDSHNFLKKFDKKIDVLYLDSYDVDMKAPHDSALHHLLELDYSMKNLKKGSLVLVDDNILLHMRDQYVQPNVPLPFSSIGKGQYIIPYMASINADFMLPPLIPPHYNNYQHLYKIN